MKKVKEMDTVIIEECLGLRDKDEIQVKFVTIETNINHK